MAVEICKKCGTELKNPKVNCPFCGQDPKKRRRSGLEKIIYIVVLILVLIALFGPLGKETDNPSSDKVKNVEAEATNDKPTP